MRQFKVNHVLLGVLCWTVVLASILLQNLYVRPLLDSTGLVLVFLASFLAGFVIKDVRYAVISWFVALLMSILIVFCVLSLPLFLGLVPHLTLGEELYAGIIVMIFRVVFPAVLMICFLACVLGAILSEKINL
jgi:hypothetical protein